MGSYCWNDNVNTVIDTEQFEKLCNRAECEPDIKERISYSAYAIDIYKRNSLINIHMNTGLSHSACIIIQGI